MADDKKGEDTTEALDDDLEISKSDADNVTGGLHKGHVERTGDVARGPDTHKPGGI